MMTFIRSLAPIEEALSRLAAVGVHLQRVDEPWLNLYTGPGYPELTSGQVVDLAWQIASPQIRP